MGSIPHFEHIILIVFENHTYDQVIGNPSAPFFNQLASQYVLFTSYYAVTHPTLPNYIALIAGDTFGIHSDCTKCYLKHTSLPDLIEASGRTWKTYQEGMPSPCYTRFYRKYDMVRNPFVYFDSIRTDAARCKGNVLPLTQLAVDLKDNRLPNYALINPDMCNSGHNCSIYIADEWLKKMIEELQSSNALGDSSAIFVTFDEAQKTNTGSCCGLGTSAGGQVATILISPQAKSGFQDSTPLSHYSLLKTILLAWNLPALGKTEEPETSAITAPWK